MSAGGGGTGQGSVLGSRPDRGAAAASLPRRPQAQPGRPTLQQRCRSCPARRRQPEPRAGGGAGAPEPAGYDVLHQLASGGRGSCSRSAPRRPFCCCPPKEGRSLREGPAASRVFGGLSGSPAPERVGGSRQSRTAPEDPRPSPGLREEWALGSARAASPPGHQAEPALMPPSPWPAEGPWPTLPPPTPGR